MSMTTTKRKTTIKTATLKHTLEDHIVAFEGHLLYNIQQSPELQNHGICCLEWRTTKTRK